MVLRAVNFSFCAFTEKKYSNLCELCDPAQTDSSGYATLNCLTKKGGDVAYVAYYYVKEFFGVSIKE
jgi:hypothetical protein